MEGMLISSEDNDISLCTDLYQLTMAAAYYVSPKQTSNSKGIFEMFVRKLPRNRSYMVAAGLEQALHFLLNLKFSDRQISYIKSLDAFKTVNQDFFEYLKEFKFTGDVWAIQEGTIVFPNEPILRIEAPIIEAQIVETYILSTINFQSLIATKASRIVNAAQNKAVIEFGSRRAHGPQAGLLAARASYIGGCIGTSNMLAGFKLGIPVFGTMAHSFIMAFEKEEEAFVYFNKLFPSAFLLVDTYDSINAVKKIIKAGIHTNGIRLDSGDLYSLSKETRKLLDEAGYFDTKIMASGDLNEYLIQDLLIRGAPIDFFAVGTELVTSRDDPAMNGVYKLVAIRIPSIPLPSSSSTSQSSSSTSSSLSSNNQIKRSDYSSSSNNNNDAILLYKIKTSPGKKTYPGPKQIHRILENNFIKTDLVTLENETVPHDSNSIPLLKKFLEKGELLEEIPSIQTLQRLHLQEMNILPPKFKDLDFVPEKFPVVYSEKLDSIVIKDV
jgi:nicotinate phosphoribosyltransferase